MNFIFLRLYIGWNLLLYWDIRIFVSIIEVGSMIIEERNVMMHCGFKYRRNSSMGDKEYYICSKARSSGCKVRLIKGGAGVVVDSLPHTCG